MKMLKKVLLKDGQNLENKIMILDGGLNMQLLFGTWNHIIPLAIVTNKTLKKEDVVEIKGNKYYINCEPNTIRPNGKKCRFYYCVKAVKECKVTNTIR